MQRRKRRKCLKEYVLDFERVAEELEQSHSREKKRQLKRKVSAEKKADLVILLGKKASDAVLNKRKKPHSVRGRSSDTAKHVEMHYIRTYLEPVNVPFDEEAARMKKHIFGHDWEKRCIWSGSYPKRGLSVDHVFDVRGGYGNKKKRKTGWHDRGLRGGDSQWNILMVRTELNSGYKIFNHMKDYGWKKHVGWQVLSREEESQCTPREIDLYTKIKQWRQYCDQRGARYCWEFPREMNIELENAYETLYSDLILKEECMKRHVPIIQEKSRRLIYE